MVLETLKSEELRKNEANPCTTSASHAGAQRQDGSVFAELKLIQQGEF